MDFLALCQRTRELCGISGTGPTSVVSQSGEMLRIVNWVNEAWREIQIWHPWGWMEGDFSFQTVASTREYTTTTVGLTAHKAWLDDTFRIYLTSAGISTENFLPAADYNWFRDLYQYGASNTQEGYPNLFTVNPKTQSLLLGPIPDAIYTVYGQYRKSATLMAASADTPTGLPSDYHMMIAYLASMKYATYENAAETLVEGRSGFQRLLSRLEDDWLPGVTIGGPLA